MATACILSRTLPTPLQLGQQHLFARTSCAHLTLALKRRLLLAVVITGGLEGTLCFCSVLKWCLPPVLFGKVLRSSPGKSLDFPLISGPTQARMRNQLLGQPQGSFHSRTLYLASSCDPLLTAAPLRLSSLDKWGLCKVHPGSSYFRKTESTFPLTSLRHGSLGREALTFASSSSGGPPPAELAHWPPECSWTTQGLAMPCLLNF